jgi:hypothetical protein
MYICTHIYIYMCIYTYRHGRWSVNGTVDPCPHRNTFVMPARPQARPLWHTYVQQQRHPYCGPCTRVQRRVLGRCIVSWGPRVAAQMTHRQADSTESKQSAAACAQSAHGSGLSVACMHNPQHDLNYRGLLDGKSFFCWEMH